MKNIKEKAASLIVLVNTLPFLALAAGSGKTLNDLISTIAGYLNRILELLMGIAVLIFVYQVIKYFMLPKDTREEGNQYVMWSLIGFFVILSFWGLVNILINTFDLGQNNTQTWETFQNIFPK